MGSIDIAYKLHNPSAVPRTVLVWNTPLEERLKNDIFEFSQNLGASYTGVLVKRRLVMTEKNTITLPANGEVSRTINALDYYNFKSSGYGTLQAKHPLWEVVGTDTLQESWIESNSFNITVSAGSLHQGALSGVEEPEELWSKADTHLCNAKEKEVILQAIEDAKEMVECEEVLQWKDPHHYFGHHEYAPEKVKKVLGRAYTRLLNDQFEVTCRKAVTECGDEGQTFACVLPNDPKHQIHVASQFWTAKRNSKFGEVDTQAGTLIHELTHFDDVGATKDMGYGNRIIPPAKALQNADTYEYICETCLKNHPKFRELFREEEGSAGALWACLIAFLVILLFWGCRKYNKKKSPPALAEPLV